MQVQYTVKYTVYQSAGRCDQGVVAVVVPAQSSFFVLRLLSLVSSPRCVCSLSLITLSEKLRHVADLLFCFVLYKPHILYQIYCSCCNGKLTKVHRLYKKSHMTQSFEFEAF